MLIGGLNVGGAVSLEVGPVNSPPTHILTLPANPDTASNLNLRMTVVQTVNSSYTDNFGREFIGIQTLQLTGNTLWDSAQGTFDGHHVDGNTAARHLEMDIVRLYFAGVDDRPMSMRLYDDATLRAYEVEPIGNVQFSRSHNDPMTLSYVLQLNVVRDLTSGVSYPKVPDPVVATFKTPRSTATYTKQKVHTAVGKITGIKQTPDPYYIVQAGDTLNSIAALYLPVSADSAEVGAYVRKIALRNHLSNPALIFTGRILRIPPA